MIANKASQYLVVKESPSHFIRACVSFYCMENILFLIPPQRLLQGTSQSPKSRKRNLHKTPNVLHESQRLILFSFNFVFKVPVEI
jgi:hypothetical protein